MFLLRAKVDKLIGLTEPLSVGFVQGLLKAAWKKGKGAAIKKSRFMRTLEEIGEYPKRMQGT